MMKVYYDYITQTCTFTGATIESKNQQCILCNNSAITTPQDILSSYQQYGADCVNHLEGAFSFCLYDTHKKQLMVVRDRIGERQMYYAQLPTGVIFATDLKDILPHIAYPTILPLNLARPIRYNFPIDLRQTWIEQIQRVQAGEYVIVDKNGLRRKTYFRRNYTSSFTGTKEDAFAESLHLLRQSVRTAIATAPGPVAVLLSGGIDSSSLAILAKEVQKEVHVISAGYKGNQYTVCDERHVAKRFAEEHGLVYHEVELDVNDFQRYLDELIPYLDEPCFDINCMVQYVLYKRASELGFKTILCGLGGDELFYSYAGHHREVEAIQLRREFNQFYPVRRHWKKYLGFMLKHAKHVLLPNHPARIDASMLTSWTYDDYTLFARDAQLGDIRFADIDVHVSLPETITIQGMYDFLGAAFAMNMCVYMANKMGASNGVEVRFPLLDTNLIRFMDSLPMDMKYDRNMPKRFQSEMMTSLLPDYILHAPKRGFEPPFEFIGQMNANYQYRHIHAKHTFFNSMVADMLIDKLLEK